MPGLRVRHLSKLLESHSIVYIKLRSEWFPHDTNYIRPHCDIANGVQVVTRIWHYLNDGNLQHLTHSRTWLPCKNRVPLPQNKHKHNNLLSCECGQSRTGWHRKFLYMCRLYVCIDLFLTLVFVHNMTCTYVVVKKRIGNKEWKGKCFALLGNKNGFDTCSSYLHTILGVNTDPDPPGTPI